MVGSASRSAAGLVVAVGVNAEVSDELVVAQDRGVVVVDDHGDGASAPCDSDVDLVAVDGDVAAGVDDGGVGLGSWCWVFEWVTGLGWWVGLPA